MGATRHMLLRSTFQLLLQTVVVQDVGNGQKAHPLDIAQPQKPHEFVLTTCAAPELRETKTFPYLHLCLERLFIDICVCAWVSRGFGN